MDLPSGRASPLDAPALWMDLPSGCPGTCLWMNLTQKYFLSRSLRHSFTAYRHLQSLRIDAVDLPSLARCKFEIHSNLGVNGLHGV